MQTCLMDVGNIVFYAVCHLNLSSDSKSSKDICPINGS